MDTVPPTGLYHFIHQLGLCILIGILRVDAAYRHTVLLILS